MMDKFTRGPWKALGREVYADVGIPTIHVLIADCRFGRDEHLAETIANTNLIAAAPDMYEALKQCAQFWEGTDSSLNAIARAALAKADGHGDAA